MFVLGNFIFAVTKIADIVLNLLFWIIVIRALLSWVNPDPYNQIVQIIHRISDPIINPFRRLLPMHNLGIDFAPMLAIFAIWFTQWFLIQSLFRIAINLQ